MNTASQIRLLALAAIWGACLLLLRIAAPVLGPVPVIIGGTALTTGFHIASVIPARVASDA